MPIKNLMIIVLLKVNKTITFCCRIFKELSSTVNIPGQYISKSNSLMIFNKPWADIKLLA